MKIFPWQDKKYYEPGPQWSWLPIEHQPGGTRALHDDFFCWPLTTIPRTFSSYIFLDWKNIGPAIPTNYFIWNGKPVPKPWQEQKILVKFQDPITKEILERVYECRRIGQYLQRSGARISDDLEATPPTTYVNWLGKLPLGHILTFAVKKI